MSKKNATYSIDETTLGEIERISAKKGESRSDIVEKYILRGLAKELELTSLERMNAQDKVINLALDSILKLYNLELEGGVEQKINIISLVVCNFSASNPLRERNRVAQLSLFEILKDIEDYDLPLFQKISKLLTRNLKQTFLGLYPEQKT